MATFAAELFRTARRSREPNLVTDVAEAATSTSDVLAFLEGNVIATDVVVGVRAEVLRGRRAILVGYLEAEDEAAVVVDLDFRNLRDLSRLNFFECLDVIVLMDGVTVHSACCVRLTNEIPPVHARLLRLSGRRVVSNWGWIISNWGRHRGIKVHQGCLRVPVKVNVEALGVVNMASHAHAKGDDVGLVRRRGIVRVA